jgi:transcriptional regulator with XRE-family HTH domain
MRRSNFYEICWRTHGRPDGGYGRSAPVGERGAGVKGGARMILLRRLVGDVLRRHRLRQSRTLRDVSAAARVSLGYLSEVERGRKEASSELLASICTALDVSLADVLREVSDDLASIERRALTPRIGFVPSTAVSAATVKPARTAAVATLSPTRSPMPAPAVVASRGQRPVAPVAMLSVTPVIAA